MVKFISDLGQVGDFSLGTPVSSTNKTDRLDMTEILLKVALNTITSGGSRGVWRGRSPPPPPPPPQKKKKKKGEREREREREGGGEKGGLPSLY